MTESHILQSQVDASFNCITDTPDGGKWEARWVQRSTDYGIVYLSSHSGCAYSCRFCHLTATGQTMMLPATLSDYAHQLHHVWETVKLKVAQGELEPVRHMHVNFMARGEPLANPTLVHHAERLWETLDQIVGEEGYRPEYLVSTIVPNDYQGTLACLDHERVHGYYSLYTVNPEQRKKWLGKAMNPSQALPLWKTWQERTGKELALHWAFIEGMNDSLDDMEKTLELVERHDIRARFNLVRYNPYSAKYGQEPNDATIQSLAALMSQRLGQHKVKIIPRVGPDVFASCGMFAQRTAATNG